jgi:hypothetical protein
MKFVNLDPRYGWNQTNTIIIEDTASNCIKNYSSGIFWKRNR